MLKKLKKLPFWNFILNIYEHIQAFQLNKTASSLAYTTILSVIPLLAISLVTFRAMGGMEQIYKKVTPFLIENLSEPAGIKAQKTIEHFIDNIHSKEIGIIGFIMLIITSMTLLSTIETVMNQIWKSKSKRTLFFRVSSYWFFISLGPLALSVVIGMPGYHAKIGTAFFLYFFFFFFYKFVPNEKVYWRPAAIAALFTFVFITASRIGIVFYAKQAISYHTIYGGLAAIPIFLIWIHAAWLIVLLGGILSFELQKSLRG